MEINYFELLGILKMIIVYTIKITLCAIVIYVIRYKVSNRRKEMLAANIPGPRPLPILGNALEVLGSTKDILKSIDRIAKIYPSPTRFWLGPMLVFLIHDPEDIQVILNSKVALEKDYIYKFFESHLGHGLITAPVSDWRRNRRILGPTFNSQILQTYFQVYNKQAKLLVEKLEPKCAKGRQFDMSNFVSRCILDTVCETMMGVKLGTQDNFNMDYLKAISNYASSISIRAFTFWMYPDWSHNLTRNSTIQAEALLVLNAMVEKVITEKKEAYRLKRTNELENVEENDGAHKRKGFLDHLLDLTEVENTFSVKELQDEVSTFIAAGYDTSAALNSTVLILLAIHQDEQARVYDELQTIFGNSDREVTMEDTKLMTRLDMVMMEAMRLFTTVPLIGRLLTSDLQVKNHTLPKGSSLAIWTQTMHRNSEIYPEPDKFDPERFLPENSKKRHPYSFLPFSAGPRNCIGNIFASLMSKVLLASVIRKYHLQSDTKMEDIQMEFELVQKPFDGFPMRLEPRDV